MDGSPLDGAAFLILIISAFVVLFRRRLNWPYVVLENWPIFLFYFFLLVSVLWANSPPVSFKRWFKEFGNIAILLVILTEQNPQQAIRAVFVRCAYLLFPLSVIFIRFFPSVGRYYSSHGGEGEFTGVTMQKNSLGALVLICGLIILWDWLELRRTSKGVRVLRKIKISHWGLLLIGAYLFRMCNSVTSMVCFAIGAAIILTGQLPVLRRRLQMLAVIAAICVGGFWVLDQTFGLKKAFFEDMGRNMTLTGRTDVWQELCNVGTDPFLGTGFMSFWDDQHFQSKLPDWVAFSAHNGYLEILLAGGWVGVSFLSLMILGVGWRVSRALPSGTNYSAVRFAIFVVALVANYTESNFAEMTPLGFLFLLGGIGSVMPSPMNVHVTSGEEEFDDMNEPESVTGHPLPCE